MIECRNCRGNLRFDIARQQMYCKYCDTWEDPAVFATVRETDGIQESVFEAQVFTCPQCAGELICEEKEAAVSCPYCGGDNFLSGRMEKKDRPLRILPFSRTLDECKEEYWREVKRAIYAPKELRSRKHTEEFKGMYMPYWYYHYEVDGPCKIQGRTTSTLENVTYVRIYDLIADVKAEYEGVTFDASSSFADELSQGIAPYNIRDAKPFNEAYISGFYAEMPDVPKERYVAGSRNVIVDDIEERLMRVKDFAPFQKEPAESGSEDSIVLKDVYNVMLPVWFLCHRTKKRVAYAVINGQTGKVATDLPVDIKRFLLFTLLTAVPIYILLSLLPVITPKALLTALFSFAMGLLLIYSSEITKVRRRELNENDIGKGGTGREETLIQKIKRWRIRENIPIFAAYAFLAIVLFIAVYSVIGSNLPMVSGGGGIKWVCTVLFPFCVLFAIKGTLELKKIKRFAAGHITIAATQLLSLIVLHSGIAEDLYYYACAGSILVGCVLCLADLIRFHNMLTTRPLPQFQRGGKHNE